MPRFFRSLLALAFLIAVANSLPAETLRVATYNVQNYNLEFRRIGEQREPEYPKPENEKAALRFIIRAANADVLALQETGGQEFINELQRDLEREKLVYPYVAVLEGPDKKRQLAILSRRPFKKVLRHPILPLRDAGNVEGVSRGLLGVTFDTPGGDFTFYTLHLKSRLTRDSADPLAGLQRLAEATAICSILRETHGSTPNAWILIGGDFNDDPTSSPVRRFFSVRQTPPFTPIPARDSRGETWTYRNIRADFYSRSDYFMISPLLSKQVCGPASIADLPAGDFASDHRLLFVDLKIPLSAPVLARPENSQPVQQ
jgi:endonuclease/exonuclease/phosphatase family metal-dependent hydrolase